jgi:hypothetical protein
LSRRQAIDIAMDAMTTPEITSFLSAGPLPEGLKYLLRIVAEGEWRDAPTEHVYRAHSPEAVRAASAAFLSVVLFARQTDPYRVLGLQPAAPLSEVREHKRLLLKWLHPDRNPKAKEHDYLARIIEAADAIEGGRCYQFGAIAGRHSPHPPPGRPLSPQAAKTLGSTPKARRSQLALVRSARQMPAGSIVRMIRAVKLSVIALATLLLSLVAWRYFMDEPIGSSLTRFAKLGFGIIAWE